ncbi:MAG: T9SS type A sorting domain-containing protein [Bacteroidia bacterium]|nr:T9SS type A sorting domain-containing protein [Bacteroidia bacterium]
MLIACTFLFKNIYYSQNLIQNPSFESYTNALNNLGGFDNYNATPVYHVLDNWYGYFTPDYFHDTCINGPAPNQYGFDIPVNFFGYANTKNGNAYIGFAFYQKSDESKEYVYQQLSSPLQAGKNYCINFFVSRAVRSTYAIKNIEVLFSNSLISLSNGYIQANAQIVKQANFITDTTTWTEIQGCFTAAGGEQYLMIGNFNSNANTDTLFIGTSNPIPFYGDFSYYYIEDITLIDQSTVGVNELGNGATINVFPNPANDIVNFQFSDVNSKRKIVLYNTIGEVVLTEDATTQNSSLKTHHLLSGIYFYTILVGDKNIKTNKIVIIK